MKVVNGSIVRFDKTNGDVVVINDGEISSVDNQIISESQKTAEPPKAKSVKKIEKRFIPGTENSFWLKSAYKWRDGKILYVVQFGPYSEDVQNSLDDSSISLRFLDKDSFAVTKTTFNMDLSSRAVDSDGINSYWNYTGSINCNEQSYDEISGLDYMWTFSENLDNAIKKPLAERKRIDALKLGEKELEDKLGFIPDVGVFSSNHISVEFTRDNSKVEPGRKLVNLGGLLLDIGGAYHEPPYTEQEIRVGPIRSDCTLEGYESLEIVKSAIHIYGCSFGWAEEGELVDIVLKWEDEKLIANIIKSNFWRYKEGSYLLKKD